MLDSHLRQLQPVYFSCIPAVRSTMSRATLHSDIHDDIAVCAAALPPAALHNSVASGSLLSTFPLHTQPTALGFHVASGCLPNSYGPSVNVCPRFGPYLDLARMHDFEVNHRSARARRLVALSPVHVPSVVASVTAVVGTSSADDVAAAGHSHKS